MEIVADVLDQQLNPPQFPCNLPVLVALVEVRADSASQASDQFVVHVGSIIGLTQIGSFFMEILGSLDNPAGQAPKSVVCVCKGKQPSKKEVCSPGRFDGSFKREHAM